MKKADNEKSISKSDPESKLPESKLPESKLPESKLPETVIKGKTAVTYGSQYVKISRGI